MKDRPSIEDFFKARRCSAVPTAPDTKKCKGCVFEPDRDDPEALFSCEYLGYYLQYFTANVIKDRIVPREVAKDVILNGTLYDRKSMDIMYDLIRKCGAYDDYDPLKLEMDITRHSKGFMCYKEEEVCDEGED